MQFYIQKLTPEQESLIAIIRDKWIKIGLDTSPTNKFKAEEAINLLYECAELKPPKQILWFDNPLEAINWMICNNDTLCDRFVDYELDYKLRKTVSATIDTVVNADVKRIVEINITSEIYYSFRHISCIGHILKAVWDAFGEDIETYYSCLQSFLVDHPNGFEVEHCAFYEFFHTIGVDSKVILKLDNRLSAFERKGLSGGSASSWSMAFRCTSPLPKSLNHSVSSVSSGS
jgi:hypothetical protein